MGVIKVMPDSYEGLERRIVWRSVWQQMLEESPNIASKASEAVDAQGPRDLSGYYSLRAQYGEELLAKDTCPADDVHGLLKVIAEQGLLLAKAAYCTKKIDELERPQLEKEH